MYLPSPQLINNRDIFISGDVQIDPSAVLGPGVILQAAPYAKIIISSGACLGMGVIINAYQGVIEIETGAILGARVLVIGVGKIGKDASVGAASTIFNASVKAKALVPTGSLLGDTSRSVTELSTKETSQLTEQTSATTFCEAIAPEEESALEPDPFLDSHQAEVEEPLVNSDNSFPQPKAEKPSVIGKVYINHLLVTLFPEKRAVNNSQKPD